MKTVVLLIGLLNFSPPEETIRINKSYSVDDPNKLLLMVNNVYGSIDVEPSTTGKVELALEIKVRANSQKLLDQAKKDLKLGEYFGQDSIIFYTKAPFIRDCDGPPPFKGGWWNDQPDYDFSYEYTLKVPANSNIYLKTVNDGEIGIKNMSGEISAKNVNGGLNIIGAKKLVQANTVNGDIDIEFASVPKESIDFKTVNGDFNLNFPSSLASKVYFDTMNGEMYSAFDYSDLSPLVEKSDKGSRFKISSKTGIEIGAGGPTLSFKSINGDVYLRKIN